MPWEPRQANAGSFQGKFRPKRGGVNCKGRDKRVEKMANVCIGFEKKCLFNLPGTQL